MDNRRQNNRSRGPLLRRLIKQSIIMNVKNHKTAFVTGGGKGIGTAIVRRFAAEGYRVIFTCSSSAKKARQLEAELISAGKLVKAIQLDITNAEATKAVMQGVGKEYGKIDVLVNNAGVFNEKDFETLTPEDYDWIMNVNSKGAFLAVLYARPYLPEGGSVINVGSVVADTAPAKGNTLYAASKSALQGFTRGLARDLGESKITVNLIQPGPVDTEMNPADAPFADYVRSRMAIPQYGQPEDIAAMVNFLALEEAKYLTGAVITMDGGFSA